MTEGIEVEAVMKALGARRLTFRTEAELQDLIGRVFSEAKIPFEREVRLGPASRIDFIVGEDIGLEVKVDGSPSAVAEQILRYCGSPRLSCVLLVTSKARLGKLPPRILGKRVEVLALWRSML